MVHLFQEEVPGYEKCKRGWHNQQFVDICEEIGLHPLLGVGAHWRPMDGQVAKLAEMIGIEKPAHAEGEFVKPEGPKPPKAYWWDPDRGGKPKGKSTLIKYVAEGCTKSPTCTFRSGRKDLNVRCSDCQGEFHPV